MNKARLRGLYTCITRCTRLSTTYDHTWPLPMTTANRVLTADNTGTPGAPNVVPCGFSYSYDGVDNVKSVTDTINGVAMPEGFLRSIPRASKGGTNAYSFSSLNRLTQLTQTGNNVRDKRVDFGYNAIGQFTEIDLIGLVGRWSDEIVQFIIDRDLKDLEINHAKGWEEKDLSFATTYKDRETRS